MSIWGNYVYRLEPCTSFLSLIMCILDWAHVMFYSSLLKKVLWRGKGRWAHDFRSCLHQGVDLRSSFDCEVTKPAGVAIPDYGLYCCSVENSYNISTDAKQLESSQKMGVLMNPGTDLFHLCVPAEVTINVHTKIFKWCDLVDGITMYAHRTSTTELGSSNIFFSFFCF